MFLKVAASFLCSLQNPCQHLSFSGFLIPSGYARHLIVVLICISMTTNDISAYLSFIYLLGEMSVQIFCLFCIFSLFLLMSFNSFLYTLNTNLLSESYFAEIFSCGLSFQFLS